jgi:hypothetical protein
MYCSLVHKEFECLERNKKFGFVKNDDFTYAKSHMRYYCYARFSKEEEEEDDDAKLDE